MVFYVGVGERDNVPWHGIGDGVGVGVGVADRGDVGVGLQQDVVSGLQMLPPAWVTARVLNCILAIVLHWTWVRTLLGVWGLWVCMLAVVFVWRQMMDVGHLLVSMWSRKGVYAGCGWWCRTDCVPSCVWCCARWLADSERCRVEHADVSVGVHVGVGVRIHVGIAVSTCGGQNKCLGVVLYKGAFVVLELGMGVRVGSDGGVGVRIGMGLECWRAWG